MASSLSSVGIFRNYALDLPDLKSALAKQSKRVALVALPFLCLYAPIGRSLSLGLGSLRTLSALCSSVENYKTGKKTEFKIASLYTTFCVVAVAGTFFAHPLGMILSTTQDLAIELQELKAAVSKKDGEKIKASVIASVNHTLYLSLLLKGGIELTVIFLAGQIFTCIYSARKEIQKGHYLEAVGHTLMGALRGGQLCYQGKTFQVKYQRPLAKLGTGFMYFANALNAPARFVSGSYERVTRCWKYGEEGFKKTQSQELLHRVSLSIGALAVLPFTLFSFLAIPFTGLAACLRGRFEFWHPMVQKPLKTPGESLTALSYNIAGQEGPFAPLTAGVVAPFEESGEHKTRLERLCADLAVLEKDVLLLQEVHGIDTQDFLASRLQAMGYHVVADRGLSMLCNNSGLFIASLQPLEEVHFIEYPLEARHGLARWSLQGALVSKIAGVVFMNTHLNYGGESAQNARVSQMQHLLSLFTAKTPTVLAGDLNFDTDEMRDGQTLLEAAGFKGFKNLCGGMETCSNEGKGRLRDNFSSGEKDDGVIGNHHVDLGALEVTYRKGLSDHYQVAFTATPAM